MSLFCKIAVLIVEHQNIAQMKQIVSLLIVGLLLGCSDGAKEFNQQFAEIEKSISAGQIGDFDSAIEKLNSLETLCNEQVVDKEMDTDNETVREVENLRKVIGKIEERIASLNQEKKAYENLSNSTSDDYDYLKQTSTFLSNYPNGLKKTTIQNDQQIALSKFVDSMSDKFNGQFTTLNEENTTSNLFQMVSYTSNETGQQTPNYQPEEFESALNNFVSMKNEIQQILQVSNVNLTTAKGNSPQSLKKQMDEYENAIRENRRKEEEFFREAVTAIVVKQGWEDLAKFEMEAHIMRDRGRGGIFSSCNASTIINQITKFEENKTSFFSNKIDVQLHYNVNSYCGSNVKTKYYEGIFNLEFPIINRQLSNGFFKNRIIRCTSNCD